jgi:hypothetical protein
LFKNIIEKLPYAFRRGVSGAFAFMARARGNEMELYAFRRGVSRAYTFTARALDKDLDYETKA